MLYSDEQIHKMGHALPHLDASQLDHVSQIDALIARFESSESATVETLKDLKMNLILSWEQIRKDKEFSFELLKKLSMQFIRESKSGFVKPSEHHSQVQPGYHNFYLVENMQLRKRRIVVIPTTKQKNHDVRQTIHEGIEAIKKSFNEVVALLDCSLIDNELQLRLMASFLANEWTASEISIEKM